MTYPNKYILLTLESCQPCKALIEKHKDLFDKGAVDLELAWKSEYGSYIMSVPALIIVSDKIDAKVNPNEIDLILTKLTKELA